MKGYRESYDKAAADYLEHWRETGENPFIPAAEVAENDNATRALFASHVPAGGVVLDVGCSIGNIMAELPQYERHGVDIAEAYLEIARERGIDAVWAEAEHLPFPDEMFDGVLAVDLFEHVLDPNVVAAEILRVTKPGGIVVVRTPNKENMAEYVDYWVYPFCHLRSWDDPTWRMFWHRIFGCEVVAAAVTRHEINVVVRKPCSAS